MVDLFKLPIYGSKIVWAVGISLAVHIFIGGWVSGLLSFAGLKAASRQEVLQVNLNNVSATPFSRGSAYLPDQAMKSELFSFNKRDSSVFSAKKRGVLPIPQPHTQRSTIIRAGSHSRGKKKEEAHDQAITPSQDMRFTSLGEHGKPDREESLQSLSYQHYLNRIRKKIERMGATVFPRDQYGKKAYGQLTVSFTITQQGLVTQFDIVRTSGNSAIDQGMSRIFQLAQPFARFPEEMAIKTDSLTITITVAFTDGERTVVL
jgi:TonB family protein